MTPRDETFTAVLDALYAELMAGVAQKCDPSWSTQYSETRFIQCADVLPATPLIRLMNLLHPILDQIAQPVEMRHGTEDLRALTDGFRLRRVDPSSIKSDRSRAQMQALFEKLGLTDFGAEMASHLDGLITEIAGPHGYHGIFFQMYREGDYISGHTDVHMGDRLDAQFLVSHGGTGVLRTLEDGFWKLHYDKPGAMNLVGPRMWHEVPPLIKRDLAQTDQPWRIGLCLRFLPNEAH